MRTQKGPKLSNTGGRGRLLNERGGLPFFNLDYFFRYRNPQAIMEAFANPRNGRVAAS